MGMPVSNSMVSSQMPDIGDESMMGGSDIDMMYNNELPMENENFLDKKIDTVGVSITLVIALVLGTAAGIFFANKKIKKLKG